MRSMEARRHELLSEIAEVVAGLLSREHALPAEVADLVGAAVADRLAEHWGGQTITYPKDAHFKATQREIEILRAYLAGASTAKLAHETGMHERSIRRLIRRAQDRAGGLDQLDLFRSSP